jgi:hypothetical protein
MMAGQTGTSFLLQLETTHINQEARHSYNVGSDISVSEQLVQAM